MGRKRGEGQDGKERKGVITAPTIHVNRGKACLETRSTSTEAATSNQETVQSRILHAYC